MQLERDIGEEIILRLKELQSKVNKLVKIKNEEEFSDTYMARNRTQRKD